MQFVRKEKLKEGMRLAKPIYNKKGVLLYDRNSKLTRQGIESVSNFGLIGLYILEPAEPLPPMTEEDMEIIRECAIESTECEREAWEEQEKLSRTKLLKQNVQVITFPDEEKEKLRRMAEPLYEKYCGDYMDLVDRIRRAGQ